MDTQVKKSHYFRKKYNSLERFISYYYQTSLVSDLVGNSGKVLEVGVGVNITSAYLKSTGLEVITCDIDKDLNSDVIADVRNLPFESSSFDVVTTFEVLEHLPWEDFERTLMELKRVSKKNVIISLPYRSSGFEFVFKFPGIRTIFKSNFLVFFLRFPWFFRGFASSGQHYWEIDGYKYRLGRIVKILKNNFKSVKKIRPVLDGYRLFFILEK
ncbi:MAG: class I SAM-dependent methyltransferase [Patescibacteria group bacterium]